MMHATRSIRCCRGFATFTAVVLIGTTAAALTMLAAVTMRHAQLTRDAAADAQLRQLLYVSLAALEGQVPSLPGQSPKQPVLPAGLTAPDIELTLRTEAGAAGTVYVTAACRGRRAYQTLVFDPPSAAWRVSEVVMP